MSKKSLILTIIFSLTLVLGITYFFWQSAPDAAIKTGEAEADVRTIAIETLALAETMQQYKDKTVDASTAAAAILTSSDKIENTVLSLEAKTLEPIELEASVASYLAFNNFFEYYEEDLIEIDTSLDNRAATTLASYKTARLLYEFAQDSVQNLKVPKYSLSNEADVFIKSESEKDQPQE